MFNVSARMLILLRLSMQRLIAASEAMRVIIDRVAKSKRRVYDIHSPDRAWWWRREVLAQRRVWRRRRHGH